MAYFYVKFVSGVFEGTKTTGSSGTPLTGTFASIGAAGCYGSIESAITNGGATSGDVICVSDAHRFVTAAAVTYIGPTTGDKLTVITVSDTNCDTPADAPATAQEETISGADFEHRNRIVYHGIYFKAVDNFIINVINSSARFENCIIEWTDNFNVTGDGTEVEFKDTSLVYVDSGTTLITGPVSLKMIGGSVTSFNNFTHQGFTNGGSTVRCHGVDFTGVPTTIIGNVGSDTISDDAIDVTISSCKMPADVPIINETLASTTHRLLVTNSSSDSAVAEYQYNVLGYGGEVEQHDTIYRDNSTAFPSGTKISLQCVTLSTATKASPFWFDFPTRYAPLSSTASDKIRVYILSSATLYDSDVWAEVIYPDGTNKHQANYISTRHDNILDTNGTELSTNVESWQGRGSENRYHIDIDTSTDAGADCYPIIRVYCAAASSTIYFCPSIGLG